jgi:3-deoxy-D-manno-octulosonic-acid transferase
VHILVSLLLNLAYFFAALIASPWLCYRAFAHGDRRGLSSRFGFGLGGSLRSSIWLHGSSAGEIALLEPLVKLLEESKVGNPIVVSAYSATGLAAARKAFPNGRVVLFPFDFSFVVRRFLARFDPCLVVIVESDFWPNFLLAANRRDIPVAVINGKMSEKSYRLHSKLKVVPALLRKLELIALQSQEYSDRLSRLGIPEERLCVTGNMKYDLARTPRQSEAVRRLREQMQYVPQGVVIMGGSLHEAEHEVLLSAYEHVRAKHHDAALVLVPRYPKSAPRVESLVAAHGFEAVRKTRLDSGRAENLDSSKVLIVDTVGELRELYAVADIAFVGGSLFYRGSNKGGHNLMEPAILGLPVIFGPYHYSFQDAAQRLVEAQAGFEVRDLQELTRVLLLLLEDDDRRRECGRRARRLILDSQGATRRNFELLMPLVERVRRLRVASVGRTMPPALGDADLGR